jgi:hypothetical protein
MQIMLIAVVVLLPTVLLYTAWVYRVMFGRVSAEAWKATRRIIDDRGKEGVKPCGTSLGFSELAWHRRSA